MFKVSFGLPIEITKSDLDELFKDYGKVQKWNKLINDQSAVFVQLDKNEELAISALDKTQWRNKYFLHLDPIREERIFIRHLRKTM